MLAAARLCAEDASSQFGGDETCGGGENGAARLSIIDEFTSFVDRPTAARAAAATRAAWLRRRASDGKAQGGDEGDGGEGEGMSYDRLICASVHEDVLPHQGNAYCEIICDTHHIK